MDSRIGRRICSARNVFYFSVVFVSLASASARGQAPADMHDCRPCTFSPGPSTPAYSFTFDLKTEGKERSVQAIQAVNLSSKASQKLPVTGMVPVGQEENFFFGGVDVNFDGFLDLMLITRRGTANAYAAYWLFDPKTGTFKSLGTYPVFRVDQAKKQLSTYERGGSGGLVYESKVYEFANGRLALIRDEKQDALKQGNAFHKTVRERVNGVMKVTKTETVKPPKQPGNGK